MPKVTADYTFRIWSHTNQHARLYLNPEGEDPAGAVEVGNSAVSKYRMGLGNSWPIG